MPLVFCRLNQSHGPTIWIIDDDDDEIKEFERIAGLLLDCAHTDDVVGARRLLESVKEQDRKSIVAKRKNCNAPLFVAAMRGNVDMAECLVKKWQADLEVSGRYMDQRNGSPLSVTPLWYAAVSNDKKMVERLLDLGADINAVSDTGDTPVLYACFLNNVRTVEILSMRGADVQKPNRFGETCLIIAAERSLELCQCLIANVADVNKQDAAGNTFLHCAIISTKNSNKDEIVQLLIDHGSNPYIKNKCGDDVFKTAILHCQESILEKLLLRFEIPAVLCIESYELLGTSYANRIPVDTEKALSCWKKALEMRRTNDDHALQLNPNRFGETCLIPAAKRSKELCQFLIDNGAEVNAQNWSGDTALHCAISSKNNPQKKEIVLLLIGHGSNPNIQNKCGDDVFKTASLECQESILEKLLLRFKPSVGRCIESYELLGACYATGIPRNIKKALFFWKKAVKMRRKNACVDVVALQPNPVYRCVQEVNTVEELETLSQNHDFIHMRALMMFERILGPHHSKTTFEFLHRGREYIDYQEYRRGIDIYRYAFQLQNAGGNPLIAHHAVLYIHVLHEMCKAYITSQQPNNRNNAVITFEELFEVLQIATTNIENITGIVISPEQEKIVDLNLIYMKAVLQLMTLITKMELNADQLFSFNKIVYRLVRCQLKTQQGQTLIHLSVLQIPSSLFQSTAVVKVLLECGADVNDIDDEYNTALHLCSWCIQEPNMKKHQELITKIAVLLVKNSAHVDMVNIFGQRAADGLTSSLMDMNMMDFVGLKCLAANAVVKHKIPYAGYVNGSLESFLYVHGKCASKSNTSQYEIPSVTHACKQLHSCDLGSILEVN